MHGISAAWRPTLAIPPCGGHGHFRRNLGPQEVRITNVSRASFCFRSAQTDLPRRRGLSTVGGRPFEQKDYRSPVYQSRHRALAHAGDLPKAWGSRSFERALVCFGAAWTKTSALEGNCETLVDLVVLF